MKHYEIRRVSGFEELRALPSLYIDHPYFDAPTAITAYAQIGYSEEALLVHLWCQEPYTRAEEHAPYGIPCEDSCLEFFFCPVEGDGRYFNIECNSNGCVYLGFASGLSNLMRMIPDDPKNHPICPEVAKIDGGWETCYKIPYDFIRHVFPEFTVYEGKTIKANCYKCADLGELPHYFSWSPIVGEPFTYHRTECFGTMTFVE